MRRSILISLLLFAFRVHADCGATSPASQYTVDFRTPVCNAAAPCLQNSPVHFSITPRAGACFIPFYSGPCPAPYVIDSCDTLTWDFGDGTPAQVVAGSGEVDHVFPKAGSFTILTEIRNGAGSSTVHSGVYICADPPSFLRFSQPIYNVAENGGSVTVTLERSGDLSRAFSLDYTTFPNWPAGEFVRNLEPLAMKVSFAPGEIAKTITHRLQDDSVFSGDSDHSIGVLSDGAAIMATGPVTTAVIHVVEDEAGPEFTIDDAVFSEGVRQHAVNLSLHLSRPAADRVYAWCVPHDGTAHAGSDFLLLGSSAIFEPGQTSATCQVEILGNRAVQPDRTFTVTTDPVLGPVTVKKGTAVCTLLDDDLEPAVEQALSFAPFSLQMLPGATDAVTLLANLPASVTLTSSSPDVVRVESPSAAPGTVHVTALKAGVAMITAIDGTATATLRVEVTPPLRRRSAR
jgi:hypothetical protein